jgi:hypothetical protein
MLELYFLQDSTRVHLDPVKKEMDMGKKTKLIPNTHLGAVTWHRQMIFGSLLYVCQGLLGLDPNDHSNYNFINSKKYSVGDLRDFFSEFELEDGKLGLHLHVDDMGSTTLATIKTTFSYGQVIPDQLFLNLITDFIEHVRDLPLGKPGDDPLTEEELLSIFQDTEEILGPIFEKVAAEGYSFTSVLTDEDEIPF